MLFSDGKNGAYMEMLLERLLELTLQSHGHTLVLFTCYRMMEAIYRELLKSGRVDYPLFCMGKGRLEMLSAFKKSENGMLLASDSAGEGIDLAGIFSPRWWWSACRSRCLTLYRSMNGSSMMIFIPIFRKASFPVC